MFDNIAPRYDRLNHTLSLNVDRIWRRRVVNEVGVRIRAAYSTWPPARATWR